MPKPYFAAALLLATLLSAGAAAAYDITLDIDTKYAPGLQIEKPSAGRNFGEHVVSYVRFLPRKGSNRVFPAFINTHNYLTCPDSEKRTAMNDVRQVGFERRSGVKVLGFFFDNPNCEDPKFHMEPILAE